MGVRDEIARRFDLGRLALPALALDGPHGLVHLHDEPVEHLVLRVGDRRLRMLQEAGGGGRAARHGPGERRVPLERLLDLPPEGVHLVRARLGGEHHVVQRIRQAPQRPVALEWHRNQHGPIVVKSRDSPLQRVGDITVPVDGDVVPVDGQRAQRRIDLQGLRQQTGTRVAHVIAAVIVA